MRKFILLITLLQFTINNAQVSFTENIVSTNVNSAGSVHSADIDGDGDMDVISAAQTASRIYWHENSDGLGNFTSQYTITEMVNSPSSIYGADLDGDGDIDIVSASYNDDKIAWYENIDGLGNFSGQQIISSNANGAYSVYVADFDGDNDFDILTSSSNDNTIAWYENIDGFGNFSSINVINSNASAAGESYAIDIDNDGDIDVLFASSGKIAWHENTNGLGTFSSEQIILNDSTFWRNIYAVDIDDDGDIDVFCSSATGTLALFKNTDGQGNFGTQQNLMQNSNLYVGGISSADIDLDNDLDIISTFGTGLFDYYEVAWFENIDGLADNFISHTISSNLDNPYNVFIYDFNNDGKKDVLSNSLGNDTVVWFENSDNLSVQEYNFNSTTIYPIPASNSLIVQSSVPIKELTLYNNLGKTVVSNLDKNTMDISHLSIGIYFLKIWTIDNQLITKKIIKK